MTDTIVRALVVHPDTRGSVREAYRESWFPGVPPVRQIVHSISRANVLRGMHAHKRQYDIWHFVMGEAQVQLFDHRTGEWQSIIVGTGSTIVIPPGVSHGFYTRLGCTLTYFLTEEYDGSDEYGWSAFDTDWPGAAAWEGEYPLRSERDIDARSLRDFAAGWDA